MSAKRYALLIGNSIYEDKGIIDLNAPKEDILEIRKILLNKKLGAFDKVISLLNKTSAEVIKALGVFFKNRKKDDLLLLYYSGHGLLDKDINLYLTTSDTINNNTERYTTTVPATIIKGLISNTNSNKHIIIIDSCTSGAFSNSKSLQEKDLSNQLHSNGSGTFVITASDSTQEAFEGSNYIETKYSLFTHFFIDGIVSGNADTDNSGFITISELYNYIFEKMKKVTKEQTPTNWSSNQKGNLIISNNIKLSKKKKRVRNITEISIRKTLAIVENDFFPILSSLNQNAFIEGIASKADLVLSSLDSDNTNPVVLLGLTGVGKTSLLNAILHANIGASGGGGAQSAASLIVKQKKDYQVIVEFLTIEDLQKYADIININKDKKDLFKRPDEQNLPESLIDLFYNIGLNDEQIGKKELELEDFNQDISKMLTQKSITNDFKSKDLSLVSDYIKNFTNTRRKYWSITKKVTVSGPFKGIEPNISIVDLPGLGDLNMLRVEKAKEVLLFANQIIIVLGERGFTQDIKNLLSETSIISYLLTSPEIPQILLVGTKLDNINVNDSEIEELGLDIECEDSEIITARFERWKKLTKKQWQEMLMVWFTNTSIEKQSSDSVDKIIEHTSFIPSSPIAYLCLNKLERSRTKYENIFPLSKADKFNNTGIPLIRKSILSLSKRQKELREIKIKIQYKHFLESVYNIGNLTISNLSGVVTSLKKTRLSLKEFIKSISLIKIKSFTFNTKQINKSLDTKLIEINYIIKTGWKDLDEEGMNKIFSSQLKNAHFQTLKAALIRGGAYKSKGISKTIIDVPKEIGVYVTEPIAQYVYKRIIDYFLNEVEADIKNNLDNLIDEISSKSDKLTGNDNLLLFKEKTQNLLKELKAEIIFDLQDKMPETKDFDVFKLAHYSIGSGFVFVMNNALNKEKGKGARERIIKELSTSSYEMLSGIIDESSKIFKKSLIENLQESVKHLYVNLENKKIILIKQIIEIYEFMINDNMDTKSKETKRKKIETVLRKLPSIK